MFAFPFYLQYRFKHSRMGLLGFHNGVGFTDSNETLKLVHLTIYVELVTTYQFACIPVIHVLSQYFRLCISGF